MPSPTFLFSLVSLYGRIYAVGGYNSSNVREYNPLTDSWANKTPMSEAKFTTCIPLAGKILAIGGTPGGFTSYLRTVEEFDPIKNTWTALTSLPTDLYNAATAVLNDNVYVFGGADGPATDILNIVRRYDRLSDSWTSCARMPTARHSTSAIVYGNRVYVIGGYTNLLCEGQEELNPAPVERYDPSTDSWAILPGITHAGTAMVLKNDTLYVLKSNTGMIAYDLRDYSQRWTFAPTNALMSWDLHAAGERLYALCGAYSGDTNIEVQIYQVRRD
jgi:N-acetylneuraminic acid mutarotase